MKKGHLHNQVSALALASLTGLAACSSGSDLEDNPNVVIDEQGTPGVKSEFVISIPRSVVGTRMSDDVTQSAGTSEQFRGMDNILLIPYDMEPAATTDRFAEIISLSSIHALQKEGELNYKVYADQYVPIGTKHFLFYGKAIGDASSQADKFKYGVLVPSGLNNADFNNPGNITFALEQINSSAEQQAGNSVGRNIVSLMTDLANTTCSGTAPHNMWSTATNIVLASLYKNFLGTTVSSSNNLAAILGMIYASLERIPETSTDPEKDLAKAIRDKILAVSTGVTAVGLPVSLKSDYSGYPANIGLPDGAVRVRWDGSQFVDMTANYNKNLKADLTDYVYPAALWYYVSTPLKASNSIKSDSYDYETSWANVISNVYGDGDNEVGATTQSVALKEPVQYGVGRIETRIDMGTGIFLDGNGEEVYTGTGYPLKGLLIGGQGNAAFDFSSKGGEARIIYDSDVTDGITAKPGTTTAPNHTLALQTKGNQVVYAALELVNGGDAFQGADGIIPAGGTFYLPTVLDPTKATNYAAGTLDKIVMKDHVTKLTVTINNGFSYPDRNGDGTPDKYVFDANGVPVGVDANGDGTVDPYDIDGDGAPDAFITAENGGPGWDTDGDGIVDIPVLPNPTSGKYPVYPNVPGGLGNATNGIPNLSSPGIELGTSVDLKWEEGLKLNTNI